MKLLAVSDLHFALVQFDWVTQQAPNYDAVVIAGDLLDIAGHLELDSQILIVEKYLRTISTKTQLFVCSGNHDGDTKTEANEYVARWLQRIRTTGLGVDGGGFDLKGARVSVCPWWDGPATRSSMQDFLETERMQKGHPWIWVHHAPPDGAGVCWTGKKHAGDAFLGDLIRAHQPNLVFSGHIHNSPFLTGGSWASRVDNTWVFNPGKLPGAPPSHISLDLTAQRATWFSQTGVEVLDLSLPQARPSPV